MDALESPTARRSRTSAPAPLFTNILARRVGPNGTVYAGMSSGSMLEAIRRRSAAKGLLTSRGASAPAPVHACRNAHRRESSSSTCISEVDVTTVSPF